MTVRSALVLAALTLSPPALAHGSTVYDLLALAPQFSTFRAALRGAGLEAALEGFDGKNSRYTLFAPTNDAFAKLPRDVTVRMLSSRTALIQVMKGHVLMGEWRSAQLRQRTTIRMLGGGAARIRVARRGWNVGTAHVIKADLWASNGVVHAIDTVLMPGR